jgi:hypothetical protein
MYSTTMLSSSVFFIKPAVNCLCESVEITAENIVMNSVLVIKRSVWYSECPDRCEQLL